MRMVDFTFVSLRHSRTTRDRASPGTEPEDHLEGVSHAALGADRGRRFLHRGNVDPARVAALHRSIFHGLVHAPGEDGRHRLHREWVVDEPDREEDHRSLR
jgi:hypothetical protein